MAAYVSVLFLACVRRGARCDSSRDPYCSPRSANTPSPLFQLVSDPIGIDFSAPVHLPLKKHPCRRFPNATEGVHLPDFAGCQNRLCSQRRSALQASVLGVRDTESVGDRIGSAGSPNRGRAMSSGGCDGAVFGLIQSAEI